MDEADFRGKEFKEWPVPLTGKDQSTYSYIFHVNLMSDGGGFEVFCLFLVSFVKEASPLDSFASPDKTKEKLVGKNSQRNKHSLFR